MTCSRGFRTLKYSSFQYAGLGTGPFTTVELSSTSPHAERGRFFRKVVLTGSKPLDCWTGSAAPLGGLARTFLIPVFACCLSNTVNLRTHSPTETSAVCTQFRGGVSTGSSKISCPGRFMCVSERFSGPPASLSGECCRPISDKIHFSWECSFVFSESHLSGLSSPMGTTAVLVESPQPK